MKKILKWLDNYWYHYKWQTIIGVFFAVVIVIFTTQFITKEEYDYSVIYAGPGVPTANQTREMEKAFSSVLEKDLNGDGKKNATLLEFYLLTEEQKDIKQQEADAKGEILAVNWGEMQNTRNNFTTHVFTGESMICLLDPEWYEMLREQDAFLELSEITGELPDCAQDGYSLRLCDTPFAQYYTVFSILPSDTLLCFRRPSTASLMGSSSQNEKYAGNKEIFRAILEWK